MYTHGMIRGINQSEIARATGFTQPQISDWLAGKKTPRHENLVKLADAMGMDPAQLSMLLTRRRQQAVQTEHLDTESFG